MKEAIKTESITDDSIGEVIDLSDRRPHIRVESLGGNQHIVPLEFFKGVGTGATSIADLEEYENILPTIINEWLQFAHGIDPTDI